MDFFWSKGKKNNSFDIEKNVRNNLFFVIEGPDGSGKTTIGQKVVDLLNKKNQMKSIYSREPGGIELSEDIRQIILNNKNNQMDIKTEILLFAASRSEHTIKTIIPSLNKGEIVICDRFVPSSIVYQGYMKNNNLYNEIKQINDFATNHLEPKKIFYLDVDSKLLSKRLSDRKNNEKIDRFDNATINEVDKLKQSYEKYLSSIKNKQYIRINIDDSRTIDDISEEIVKEIIQVINK